ncbi:lipopolysaccharide core biosynthesis protein [compost metagenome]
MTHLALVPRLLRSRPLTKGLRYLYRYTHPGDHRHNETLWPFVKVRRDERDRLVGCDLQGVRGPATIPLDQLPRGIGGDAHLILSGPSVAQIDYAQCAMGSVMGVNGSIALRAKHPTLRFDYYAMLDAGFVKRRRDLVADVLAQDLLLFVTPEVYRWIALLFENRTVRCRIAVFEEVHQRALQPRARPDELEAQLGADPELVLFDARHPMHAHGFSLNPARGLFGGGTVAYTSLQFLAWLGARTVYMHGLDLTATAGPRFYESADSQLPTALDRQFSGHIEPAFRQASRLLGERGIKVYNLSLLSRLGDDVFEKRHWSCLLDASPQPLTTANR